MAQLHLLDAYLGKIESTGRAARSVRARPGSSSERGPVQQQRTPSAPKSLSGEEACRVAISIHLEGGDLISDIISDGAPSLLQSRSLAEIIHAAYANAVKAGSTRTGLSPGNYKKSRLPRTTPGHLPQTATALERLHQAIGAAAAQAPSAGGGAFASGNPKASARSTRSLCSGRMVLVYLYPSDLSDIEWQGVFALLAANPLPLLIVTLPFSPPAAVTGRRPPGPGRISNLATRHRVPGILVDCDDAVALYRVATESFGRIRSGDGAVLLECGRVPGSSTALHPQGALDKLRQTLLERELVKPGWFERIENAFQQRLRDADR